ncbi:zinc knuckle [Paramuricea clavata]|uniref:Zinc knuckle, partial n=1 Tax=Paramuricea clavata TaxID=317549 RepID=A0A6S7FN66_PARCT|nr:zinc knuckle [Paramuricea clavata]
MTEGFERKRAIRSANRGVITKHVKEATELFSKIDENGCIERLTTLDRLLDEKLKFVRKLDEEILEACSVESITQDLEEAEKITSKVYDIRKKIEVILTKNRTSCEQFRDIDTRKNILKRDGLCFRCLGRGHRARKCDPSKKCRKCHGGHHQSICTERDPPIDPPETSYVKQDPKKNEPTKQSGQKETIKINALSFPKICAPLPLKLDVESYPHLDGLEIADASLVTDSSSEIDISIGADHYYNIVKDEVRRGNEGPIAFDTKFG